MGIIRFGPPMDIVILLKEKFDIDTFVETGTFKGKTTEMAAKYFEHVVTFEAQKSYYLEAKKRFRKNNKVNVYHGDTRETFRDALAFIEGKIIFWLDSHWCGLDSYGEHNQNPLMEELTAISQCSVITPFIFIDDARLFLSPPPMPNNPDDWPNISDIILSFSKFRINFYSIIFEDVIIAVPEEAKNILLPFVQQINTKKWKSQGKSNNQQN